MFHLGWFIGKGYSPHNWHQAWSGTIGADWMKPDIYMDLARGLERACFDCLILEDGSFIADAFRDSPEWYLRNAFSVPKSDPMPLVPLLGYVTKRIGIVATITTSFYPPYLAARLGATLDQLTEGRVGLNVVTAHNDRSAQNSASTGITSTICAMKWPTSGWKSATGSGNRGSLARSSPILKPACSPITPRFTRFITKAGFTDPAGR